METTLEHDTGVAAYEENSTSETFSLHVIATVWAMSTASDPIIISTPNGWLSTMPVDPPRVCSILSAPIAGYAATGPNGSIPVLVYDTAPQPGGAGGSHVRVILNNAIITSDPQLQIWATVDTVGIPAGQMIVLTTPTDGQLIIEAGTTSNRVVYAVPTSEYAGMGASTSVHVHMSNFGSLAAPITPLDVWIVLTGNVIINPNISFPNIA